VADEIIPFPLRDSEVLYGVWRRDDGYEVTIRYFCRGRIGHDNRTWRYPTLQRARDELPPGLTRTVPDETAAEPGLVEFWS
jgi:hypothetical protein